MPDQESENRISRRTLLQAAGGVTFLALVPRSSQALGTLFEAKHELSSQVKGPLPLFTALPYIQPGTQSSKLVEGQESIVVAWQTDKVRADFEVSYGSAGKLGSKGKISTTERFSGDIEDGELRLNYAATLSGLKLNTKYEYRVTMNGEKLIEGYFTTRKPRGVKTRFVAFGDNSFGDISDRATAYQAYKANPDFVMNTGDNVYEGGLDNEYARYFFPVYNADVAGPRLGAPLLRSVPFYTVIANHDVHDKTPEKAPCADFDKNPDSFAYFVSMYLPNNGPKPTYPATMIGKGEAVDHFFKATGDRYPSMANYSYDYGDAHFLCLDSNVYVDPTDAALQAWIESDLKGTDAAWKFVVFHHPAFNVGIEHYTQQHMRVLAPLFERCGVDMVLHGHEHNYQRTRPFKFAPSDLALAKARNSKKRFVPGQFSIDRDFDGVQKTKPNGILWITTGAGGKHLYDPDFNNNPARWVHPEDGNVDYVVKLVSDRHSITVFDMDAKSLLMRQIDQWGNEIDRIRITK